MDRADLINIKRNYTVKIGRVVSVDDPYCANRIKVRLPNDNQKSDKELPFAMPFMPQVFQAHPLHGESVLVICADATNPESERFYAGPVIRQYQDFQRCSADVAQGLYEQCPAKTAYKPVTDLVGTDGAWPEYSDVALIGRKGEDVILRDNTVLVRCGVRVPGNGEDENYQGNILFNGRNAAYIQLKTSDSGNVTVTDSNARNGDTTASSVINLVADKINLVSHQDTNDFNLADTKDMLSDEEMQKVMNNLHRIPYGDVLCQFLSMTRNLVLNHVHPSNGHELAPKTADAQKEIANYVNFDLESLLSPNARTS